MATFKILIVEDDPEMAELLAATCSKLGYSVEHVDDGKLGLEKALTGQFSLVVLDISLPSLDGFEICKEIRRKDAALAVSMVTSHADEIDRVLGLELGADDYITKPFSVRELGARVKALLRRSQVSAGISESAVEHQEKLTFGSFTVDSAYRQVFWNEQEIKLTVIEFDMLLLLCSQPERPFTREALMEAVWGYQTSSFEATITAHMSRLRAKLEADANMPKMIDTVRGIGYRFVPPQ